MSNPHYYTRQKKKTKNRGKAEKSKVIKRFKKERVHKKAPCQRNGISGEVRREGDLISMVIDWCATSAY